MQTKLQAPIHLKAAMALPSGAPDGSFLVQFSSFGNIDSVGDVMLPGSIPVGKRTPLIWSHMWDSLPIGVGVTEANSQGTLLRGQFFLDTEQGKNAYATVKAMGDLQEYSFGFRVLDAEYGELDGQPVRLVKGVELFEVSPVLVGANRQTGTLAIKAAPAGMSGMMDHIGAIDDLCDEMPTAVAGQVRDHLSAMEDMLQQMNGGKAALLSIETVEQFEALTTDQKIALYYDCLEAGDTVSLRAVWSTAFVNSLPDSAFAAIEPGGKKDSEGKTTPRSLRHFPHHGSGGSPDAPHVRNGLARVPQSNLSTDLKDKAEAHLRNHAKDMGIGTSGDHTHEEDGLDPETTTYADELERVLTRTTEIRALRAKAKRRMSDSRMSRLRALHDQLGSLLDEVDQAIADEQDDEGKGLTDTQTEIAAIFANFTALDDHLSKLDAARKRRERLLEPA